MGETLFEVRDNKFILYGEVLLDCNDRIHNYSRVPMHRIAPGGQITIPELIIKNYNDQKEYDKGTAMYESSNIFLILDSIMSKVFVDHGEPINICEIGCDNGNLSMHISSLMAEFAPENDYVAVCHSLGSDEDNEWINHISQVKNPKGLQLIAADYSHTNLRDKYFDITVINGTVPIADPFNVIKEAVRITNDDGYIICYSHDQYLLDDTFKLMFSNRKEYRINPEQVIYKALSKDAWKS